MMPCSVDVLPQVERVDGEVRQRSGKKKRSWLVTSRCCHVGPGDGESDDNVIRASMDAWTYRMRVLEHVARAWADTTENNLYDRLTRPESSVFAIAYLGVGLLRNFPKSNNQ